MRAPVRFVRENLVWSQSGVWSLYRLGMTSYAEAAQEEKLAAFGALAGLLHSLERDWQILRVERRVDPEDYVAQARAGMDERHGRPDALTRQLEFHRRLLAARRPRTSECYLAAHLEHPRGVTGLGRTGGAWASGPRQLLAEVRARLGLDDPCAASQADLARLARADAATLAGLLDYLEARRATTAEIEWLIRRAHARGVGEPERVGDWRPDALVIEDPGGSFRLRFDEHRVLRLFDAPLRVGRRGVCAELEGAESHQALLVLGELSEEVAFPGHQAELLFAPLRDLDFPVDACAWATRVDNRQAAALVRRRIVDADEAFAEESLGDHGPGAATQARPEAARRLEAYLAGAARPPLLRATVGLVVGAPDPEELERRVQALRRAYAPVALHRPIGEQLGFWLAHLPAQEAPVRDWESYLLVENLAAMVPHATDAVGTRCGPYLGRGRSGAATPVLWDLTAASAGARPPAQLILGTPGSGKTVLLETLAYQAYLLGSLVVDIDPKGDHALERLVPADDLEVIELGGDDRFAGLLDPAVTAPPAARVDATATWLTGLLPAPVRPEWQIEIRRVVGEVLGDAAATSRTVLDALLADPHPDARAAGRAVAVWAESGLSRLGFADAGPVGARARRAVTVLRIRNLPRPLPGTPAAELTEGERIGRALVRLLATFAMHLVGEDRSRHKVIGLDEAFFLLADAEGRCLVEQLNRWARSEFASPILVTHLVGDAAGLDNLIGARVVMGMQSEEEAGRALALLGLDPDDRGLRRRLVGYRAGACLVRDGEGRVGAVQVELPDPGLLAALDTTPGRARATAPPSG